MTPKAGNRKTTKEQVHKVHFRPHWSKGYCHERAFFYLLTHFCILAKFKALTLSDT